MQGEVIIPFVAQLNGRKYRFGKGQVIDIPPGADWVTAGFVTIAEQPGGQKEEIPLTAVSGIGPKTAKALAAAGIGTLAELVAASAADLADLLDTSAGRIEEWQQAAEELMSGD